MKEWASILYKIGIRETNYLEDESLVVLFNGKYYNIREVKLNKDGSITKR